MPLFAADPPAPLQGQEAVPKQVPHQMARKPGLQVGSLGALEKSDQIQLLILLLIWFYLIQQFRLHKQSSVCSSKPKEDDAFLH